MSASSSYLSPEYFRFRRRLVLGFLLVACFATVGVFWKIYSSYMERENTTRFQTQALVHMIADHAADSIQLADYALMGFEKDIESLSAERKNFASTIQQLFASHPAPCGEIELMFVGVNGVGLTASKGAVQGVSYADFFQARAWTPMDKGLYIGAPITTSIQKKTGFTLSRRVVSAQGEFLGLVVAMIDVSGFAAMFERAHLSENLSISLVQAGGKINAHVSRTGQSSAATHIESDRLRQLREVPVNFLHGSNPVDVASSDSASSIYSFHSVANRPLEVLVEYSGKPLSLALWQDLQIGGAGIVLMVTIMLLSGHVALISYRALDKGKQALGESESRWKFALEGAGEGVWDWNLITGETYFSPRWKQMLGYADDEVDNNADAWRALMHPDDQPLVAKRCEACKLGETPTFDSEHRMLCKDGRWKWILSRGMIVSRDAAGQALRMIGTHADVSDRKQTEQAQVHRIVDAAPDPMLLVGPDGMITFANSAAQSTFGYPFEELIGQHADNLVQFTSRSSHAFLHKSFETGLPPCSRNLKGPLTALHRDGTGFPVETSLSSFQMNGQVVVIAHIRDISDRKRAEELLQQSFIRVRRLSDHQENIKEYERKRIAQDIHDDLGQNLLALKMDVAALHSRTAQAHPKLNKRVAIVLKNIDNTIQSVKSIMNDLRPATLELGLYPAVEWQVKQFERVSGIACRLSTGPEAGFGLDEGQTLAVFRILQESLANVVRHAWATSVEIVLSGDRRRFSMTVSDNGKGMGPGDRKKANSFGLIGVGERVHSFGGDFTVTSSPGNGTVLSISMPVKATVTAA